jgi:SET domain-containing protein
MISVEEDNAQGAYIGRSVISGYGLFAKDCILKDEIVLDYRPFYNSFYKIKYSDLTEQQINKNWHIPLCNEYCLTNDRTNKIHYINHSRTPNCSWYIEDFIIKAARDIMKDEELLIDYRKESRPNRTAWPDWI